MRGILSLWFVWLIGFIWLVSFKQTIQMNKAGRLLDIGNLPINRWQINALKALIDAREAPASEKLPG
jgi:hypothetical protein